MNKKLVVVGIIILLISVGLSGCTSEGANIKIISVDVDEVEIYPYITCNVTVNLKNIGGTGTKVQVYLGFQHWNEQMDSWYAASDEDIETVYVDAGYTISVTMSVTDRLHSKSRIYIQALKRMGDDWYLSDEYEKII